MLHDTKMRKALAALLVLALACLGALPAGAEPAEAETASYGTLLLDMLASYESQQRLDVDAALLDDDVACAIAEHWKKVYLDPDYHLFLYGTDDPGAMPISGRHAFVVLGYELKDGEMTEELRGRCDAAVAAALAWPDSILVCSGGATGKNNPDGHTEAGLMKEYLVACGIEPERVFTDERAMTTAENAINTFEILREQGIETMTIVTSSYHQRWGQVLYNALCAQYQKERGYSARIIGNYCYDTEPSNEVFLNDAQIAIRQLGGILGLSEEEMALLPNPLSRGKRPGPDYSQQSSWAYYAVGEDKDVDLFLICPTVDVNDEFNMSMDDEQTKENFLGALNMERGIYEEYTRMYAPYYRQAAMKVYALEEAEREPWLGRAYEDVSAAFSWYLENENRGRPIVLAGFSQGADMCYRLLEEYFSDPALQEQLVAVYAIGWPCTEEMAQAYPQIRPAAAADDVGAVVSFDCEAPDLEETFITPAGKRAFAINPLNWKTDAKPADKSENLGACFTQYSGEIVREEAQLCGCYVDQARGVVKVTDIDPADYPAIVSGLPDGAYHIYDYQFFYRNLQQNVRVRIEAFYGRGQASLPHWVEGSEALASVMAFVRDVTDPDSDAYIPPSERIAVFDFDGTLYGERFPTYFDNCLFIHRALHDGDYAAAEDVRAYAEALEAALLNGEPEPDSPRSTAQMAAECFAGMTVDEYRAYVRAFMDQPAYGFDGMTYAEGFYLPMVSLVQTLSENGFTVFISSGSERLMVRELIDGTLDTWIPPYRVIGSTFSLAATNQGDQQGRSYAWSQEDEVLMEGNLVVKNQKANKVFSIVDEIGMPPVLVFGNSSGDLAMAEYCIRHGGKAWMLLCDDVERDYGDPGAAEAFAEDCLGRGIGTISMRDDFETIYAEGISFAQEVLDDAA